MDIVEDCGRSISPYVDIGQIEGAFIFGIGFVTSEKVKYNSETGQRLSNGTWVTKIINIFSMQLYIIIFFYLFRSINLRLHWTFRLTLE